MPFNLNILVKNVQKSSKALSAILEEQANGPYHILMIQEAPSQQICTAAHINFFEGIPVIGLPLNNAWMNIPLPHPSFFQVGIYVWSSIFNKFHFSTDHDLFHHDNILMLYVMHLPSSKTVLFVNLYKNPNQDTPNHQH